MMSSLEELLSWGKIGNILGVWVAVVNSAHVHTSLDLEVSLVSPNCAPWVLNNPVIDVHSRNFVSSVSNSEYCVVYIRWSCAATCWRINSTAIIHEIIFTIKSNWDWTVLEDSYFQILLIIWDVYRATNNTNWLWTCWNLACLVNSFIWVSFLSG